MQTQDAIGLVAGSLTTAAFIPQVWHTWRSKSARDISLGMFATFCLGLLLWIVYGISIHSLPVIVANVVTFALAFTILWFKLRYK